MNLLENIRVYLDYCREYKGLNDKTLKAYRIDLTKYAAFIGTAEPSKETMEEYITLLHKEFKPKTVKRRIASIRAFYNYLKDADLITRNPLNGVKIKFKEATCLPRTIPRSEIEKLFQCAYSQTPRVNKWHLRDLAVLETFFAIGARVSEISHIKASCVDLTTGTIRIMGKGAKERCIQIGTPAVLELLNRYYTSFEDKIEKCGYFFINCRGNRYSEQSIRNMLSHYADLAGIDRKITPHMFRHSFATYLIEDGVDVSCVQRLLGHSSITTTQIYIHLAAKKQAEILRTHHPRNHMDITPNFV